MKSTIKEILKQYKKVEDAYCKADSEISLLSGMVSEALGEEYTADMCAGAEIEFRLGDSEDSTIRIDEIIRMLEEQK